MRHAHPRITLELYTGAMDENSRKAQTQIVQQMLAGRLLVTQVAGNVWTTAD